MKAYLVQLSTKAGQFQRVSDVHITCLPQKCDSVCIIITAVGGITNKWYEALHCPGKASFMPFPCQLMVCLSVLRLDTHTMRQLHIHINGKQAQNCTVLIHWLNSTPYKNQGLFMYVWGRPVCCAFDWYTIQITDYTCMYGGGAVCCAFEQYTIHITDYIRMYGGGQYVVQSGKQPQHATNIPVPNLAKLSKVNVRMVWYMYMFCIDKTTYSYTQFRHVVNIQLTLKPLVHVPTVLKENSAVDKRQPTLRTLRLPW